MLNINKYAYCFLIRPLSKLLIIKPSNNHVGNNQRMEFIEKVLSILKLVLNSNTTEFLYSVPKGLI